jgi:hypothetical protein
MKCTPSDTIFCPQFIKPRHEGLRSSKNLGFINAHVGIEKSEKGSYFLGLGLHYRLMGRTSRPKAIAVLGEARVPARLEYLQDRLLDKPIDDTHGIPNLRFSMAFPGLGISTRFTGRGAYSPFNSRSLIASQCSFEYPGNSFTVIPSTPGLP